MLSRKWRAIRMPLMPVIARAVARWRRLALHVHHSHDFNRPRQRFLGKLVYQLAQKMKRHFSPFLCLRVNTHERWFTMRESANYTPFFRLFELIAPKTCVRWSRYVQNAAVWTPVKLRLLEDFHQSEALLSVLSPEEKRGRVIFDVSFESVCLDGSMIPYLDSLRAALTRENITPSNVWLLSANVSDTFEGALHRHYQCEFPIRTAGYHFYVYDIPRKVLMTEWFRANAERLYATAHRTVEEHILRPKHFMTLNLKPRPQRTALLLFLMQRGYMPKGIVTYIGNPRFEPVVPGDVVHLLSKIDQAEAMAAEFPALEAMRPITYEREAGEAEGIWQTPQDISRLIPEIHHYGGEIRIDTYFEIVTETYFSDDTNLYITEKTLRPILRFQPFIHLGAPFVLRELRKLGFKTFGSLIDESYDDVIEPQARLKAAFAEIDKLCSMPLEELHEAYAKMWEIFAHNFHHLCQSIPRLFMEDVEKNVLAKLDV